MNIHKIISSNNNFYLVDGFSNEIYQLESLEDLQNISLEDLTDYNDYQSLIPSDYQKKIINQAQTLILEITEQCNLRCSYCVFDNSYDHERNHSKKYMSFETMKSAIDNFKERVSNEAYIVFYGGEPLLQFDLIKKVVEYARMQIGNFVKFSFTTNGIYLDEGKIEFFKENQFLITVSIDGNKQIHNRYRVDVKGDGTFDTIMRNLAYIYKHYNEYYLEYIQITCVLNDIEEFDLINRFFATNYLMKDISIRFSNEIKKSQEINTNVQKKFTKNYIMDLIYNHKFQEHLIEYKYYGDLLKKIKYRPLNEEAKKNKLKCIPFARRTYVRVNGDVQFCERIENMGTSKLSTNDMLDVATTYLNEYRAMIESRCNQCFAYNYCDMCFASFVENSHLSKGKMDLKCQQFENEIKTAFEIYIELMESKPELLETL